ncbi:hypothetical protein JRO89_XS09G0061900 [Xanthoceras sorbifolium]|uniref:Retrotransposon Copia-like N-terminal domain-containing protein n=1 Tax=Xanthoceras sorbifolium TaxID=99658 RepID=A0ABQ8HKR1_9ROSI|nr:hypothetical protein JRO89_XS09G0061900 [Xanthoceras sorbifolium]
MAEFPKSSTTSTPAITSVPVSYSLHPENPKFQVSTLKLNGRNFMEWSQSPKISLISKRKYNYVNRAALTPAATDADMRPGRTKQGTLSITDYYKKLKGLLTELGLYLNMEMARLQGMVEMERGFQFLLGLNPEYDQVCDRVLSKETFPDIDEAFTLVRDAESQKELLSGKETEDGKPRVDRNSSALAGSKIPSAGGDNKKAAEKDK